MNQAFCLLYKTLWLPHKSASSHTWRLNTVCCFFYRIMATLNCLRFILLRDEADQVGQSYITTRHLFYSSQSYYSYVEFWIRCEYVSLE